MKLTPWFNYPAAPVRKGVYEVKLGTVNDGKAETCSWQGQKWYAYWNGKKFSCSVSSKHWAFEARNRAEDDALRATTWRGLAEEPTQ